jgi:hypothetical protein
VDWNNDGRKDLIVGEGDGQIRIYLNTGTDASPVFGSHTQLMVAGTNFDCVCSATPRVVDWNNDGRKDVVCGEQAGRVYLMLNTGTDASPVFATRVYLTNGTSALTVSSDSCPVVVDWNRDGKKDLIVGSDSGLLTYFQNKGTDAAPVFNGSESFRAGEKTLDVYYNAHPAVCDWDNDGRWDVICGAYDGSEAARVWFFPAPSGPYLSLFSSPGANFEPGTYANFTCVLRNGGTFATNVSATLISRSPWCRPVQSAWNVGDLAANATKTNSASPFRVWVETNALLGIIVPLEVILSGNGGAYRHTNQITFIVPKPAFSIVGYFLNDSQGNGNCALEPGETAQLIVRVKNRGYRAENVVGRMTYAYGATVTHSTSSFGTIERNATNANFVLPFGVAGRTGMSSLPYYSVSLTCDRATFTNTFTLYALPEYPRSNGVSFAWADTTGGTSLSLGHNGSALISMPAPFYCRLYQYSWSSVYVFADGYVSVYRSGSSNNTVLPSTAYPNGLFAPFWDDLDPSAGGTVRYKFFGTAPNRSLAVEWNNVPRWGDPATRVTFQVILYENGDVRYQYGPSTGINADGRSATIGIESYDGTRAMQYSFNRAGAVSNGLALYFRCSPASEDSDADGLPDAYERFYFGNLNVTGDQDSDGDALCNLHEFRAGTDPRLATSCLRCQPQLGATPGQYLLRWCSIPGRTYRVWQRTNLASGNWTLVTSPPLTGHVSGMNGYTGTVNAASSPRFWKVSTP